MAPAAAAAPHAAEAASADAATTFSAEAAQPAAAETAPPANGAGNGAAAAVDIKAEVAECLARIRKALRAPGSKPTGVLRIRTGTVLLTEGEL